MSVAKTEMLTALDYDQAAEKYLRGLPLEHFMEAIPQATQREITVESLALLKIRRPDIQYFNELLVQYLFDGKLRQVVPDNMVIVGSMPSGTRTNYAVALEVEPPFLTLEYVSAGSERKDYQESFHKYESELKVPYCLMFHPEKQDLRLSKHDGERYIRLEPNLDGRCAIEELDVEVGLLDGWVRFWYQGQLLELPAELDGRIGQQNDKINVLTERNVIQANQIGQQNDKINVLAEQVVTQANEIGQLQNQVVQQSELIRQIVDRLREKVRQRASRAGRGDILNLLANTSDLDQLDRWMSELESPV